VSVTGCNGGRESMTGVSHDSIPDPRYMSPTPDPVILTPASDVEVAAALRRAADTRQSVLIRGAGTKLQWGRPAGRVDLVLDMRRLNRILAHDHGDLTATVEAGATLADVNAALADHGQWLPLDPPHGAAATIGGILATNDSGPLRHRYGTPRDLLIGIQLATTDGVLAKAGGRVVKNVAGYDLGKLVTGSFGSLAAIVTATFKLSPLPQSSKTLQLDVADAQSLATIVRAVMASQLEPIAFDIGSTRTHHAGSTPHSSSASSAERSAEPRTPFSAVLCFASLPAVVDAQIERATAALRPLAAALRVADGDDELTVWRGHTNGIWREGDDAIVRASWLPANIAEVVTTLASVAPSGVEFIGRAAVGAGLLRVCGSVDAQVHAIESLRDSSLVGNVVIVRAARALKERVDAWGSAGDRQPVLDALKRTLDPHGVLNAGRGPI